MICEKINQFSIEKDNKKLTLIDKKGGKSKYLIENDSLKKFKQINFEEDIFTNDASKCDFGIKTDKNVFFIELKGSDVKSGVVQLLETIKATEKCFLELNFKARLIISKFPKPDLVKNTKEYKDLVKKVKHLEGKNDSLVIRNSFTEKI